MKNHIKRFLILAIVGFGLGGALAYFEMQRQPQAEPQAAQQAEQQIETTETATPTVEEGAAVQEQAPVEQAITTPTAPSGEFELIAETGHTVTHENFAGIEKLVFFGFVNCPDICPATLTKIDLAYDELDKNIPTLFITVDPARDTQQVVGDYTDMFDPRIIGLTGSQEQIDAAIDAFKVYAAKEPAADEHGGHDMSADSGDHEDHAYMMQHSAYIYLMGPDNALLDVIDSKLSAEEIAAEINQHL